MPRELQNWAGPTKAQLHEIPELERHRAPTVDKCQLEYSRVTSNRTRLTADDLERSRALIGNRHRLAILAETLEKRQRPVTAAVCGGSITLGHGLFPRKIMRYSNRLEAWLNENYPLKNMSAETAQQHTVLNKGSHGADMCAMAKRLNIMIESLPPEPDLFVLEFAVNDYQGQDHRIHLDHKTDVFFEGFEQLALCAEVVVNKLLIRYPKAAVMFLEMQTAITNRKTAAVLHMAVAKHYQVPVISFAETFFPDFYRLMHHLKAHQYSTPTINNASVASGGRVLSSGGSASPILPYPHGCSPCRDEFIDPAFRNKGCKSLCIFAMRSGEKHLKCDNPPLGREPCYVSFLAHDAVHLSAAGHQMAADLVAEAIATAGRDICQGRLYPKQILPTTGLMVVDPKDLEKRSNFVYVKDTMEIFAEQDPLKAKSNSPGFRLFGDSIDRPGWIATNPKGGESVEFLIDLPLRPCYSVYLSYLKSYEKMGTFMVNVTDFVTTNGQTTKHLDGIWKPRISIPFDEQITPDEVAGCTGRCKVTITTDPQIKGRGGNKVKIVTLSARECVSFN